MAFLPPSRTGGSGRLASLLAAIGRGSESARPGPAGRLGTAGLRDRAAGFTLIEVMMVVALAVVVTGMAIPVSRTLLARSKATGANMEVLTWFETARNRAAAERRNFEMTFDATLRTIQVQRVEPNNGRTLILRRQLPETVKFIQFSGAPDTPDLFGADNDIEFDGPSPYMFTSEGTFVDANGDPSNGTIFMGKPGQPDTGTAITVFGATGLLRSWTLSGKKWKR